MAGTRSVQSRRYHVLVSCDGRHVCDFFALQQHRDDLKGARNVYLNSYACESDVQYARRTKTVVRERVCSSGVYA